MRKVLAVLAILSGSAHAEFSINAGLSGNWFNPETPGQGIIIDVIPARDVVVIGWYTFEAEGALALGSSEQRWFTAVGGYLDAQADLTVYNTSGGAFNSARPALTMPAGTATLVFESCTRARLTYAIDGGHAGDIELLRLSPDVYCASLAGQRTVPSFFRFSAEASGTDESGNYAECHVDLIYEVQETSRLPGVVEFAGTGGGEVSRTVQDSSGAGFAFFADFFVPDVEGQLLAGDRLTFDGPGKYVDDSRLYLNLARFNGTLHEDRTASGVWTCGPFDIDVGGYVDTQQTVRGSWQITPIVDSETAALD
ncbi:MAG: hypothetical protein R3212_06830 [Xanthomonadales bacterium]|nr:hypothetical protein [Xanthomonadales bacterium]